MSGTSPGRGDGAAADSDVDAQELFRLLTPRGDAVDRVRIVDLRLPWLWPASRRTAGLDEKGLLLVRSWRPRRLQRILLRRGLQAYVYAFAPPLQHARVATPLVQRPNRGGWRLKDAVVRASARLQARELAGRSAHAVVLVTLGVPPGQWMVDLTGLTSARATVSATLSWRGRSFGATVLVRDGTEPMRFVKIAFDEARAERLRQEHAALVSVAAAAGGDSIAVPRALALLEREGRAFLIEDIVDGRVAAALPPEELAPLFERLAAWLATWNERTLGTANATDEVLELARAVDVEPAYDRWLRDAQVSLPAVTPRVAVHGDLTMWNVLSARSGEIGVVDWEDASPVGPPLSDLLYAAVDAELLFGAHNHRLQAFDAVFSDRPTAIGRLCRRTANRLALDAATARYAFHETWLRHAANQMIRGDGSEFPEIVHRRLAVDPERYPWGIGA
jgi:aminoglycoside phosphotransferase (APT) family kinase protein